MSFFDRIPDTFFGDTTADAYSVQQAEIADAQRGTLYFLANTDIAPYPRPFSVATSVLSGIFGNRVLLGDISTLTTAMVTKTPVIGTSFGQVLFGAGSVMEDLILKLDTEVSAFFVKVIDKLASIFGRFSSTVRDLLYSFTPSALGALAGKIVSAIPGWGYVNSASAVYQGARQAITSTITLFSQIWSGYDVELLGGHPSIIVNALSRHTLAKVALGVKDAALETTKIGLQAAGGIIGTLVSILSSVLQTVISFIEGLVQKFFIKNALKEASESWKVQKTSPTMGMSYQVFSEWFQKSVIPCPILAALTLSSGFVGHPYRFLKLIDSNNNLKTAADFAKGVKHIEKLKAIGNNYILEYVNEYEMRFTGKDSLVSARLNDVILGKAFPTPPPMFVNNAVKIKKVQTENEEAEWEVVDEA